LRPGEKIGENGKEMFGKTDVTVFPRIVFAFSANFFSAGRRDELRVK
jgi:hypothetical protein